MYIVLDLFRFLITSLGKLSKTPSDGTLLERTSRRFLWCWLLLLLFFLTGGFYVFGLLFFATGTPTRLLSPWKPPRALSSTLATFGCLTFCQAFSVTVLPRALRFWVGIFLPTGFFLPYAPSPKFLEQFVTQIQAGTPHPGSSSVPALT